MIAFLLFFSPPLGVNKLITTPVFLLAYWVVHVLWREEQCNLNKLVAFIGWSIHLPSCSSLDGELDRLVAGASLCPPPGNSDLFLLVRFLVDGGGNFAGTLAAGELFSSNIFTWAWIHGPGPRTAQRSALPACPYFTLFTVWPGKDFKVGDYFLLEWEDTGVSPFSL